MRFVVSIVFLAIIGCSRGPLMVPVVGTITYDGKPVEEGEILFQPSDTAIAPDAGPIKGGDFSFLAKIGERKVQIRGIRTVRMTDMGPMKEEYIPSKYNSKTTLTATVSADSPNKYSFDLLSK